MALFLVPRRSHPLAVACLLLLICWHSENYAVAGSSASSTISSSTISPVSTNALPAVPSSSWSKTTTTTTTTGRPKKTSLWTMIRKRMNLSDTVGSPLHSKTPYDRIMGCPVFAVTTPWGSPYLNMEKLIEGETIPTKVDSTSGNTPQSVSDEQSEIRMVGLYFTDPDDAVAMQCEMKQLDNLKDSDIRVSAFSLAKAIRQASTIGNGGVTTGAPLDELTGRFAGTDGRLRYKIMPSKRQLYYAARCIGKERVGLCGSSASEDALMSILGNVALDASNLKRRQAKRDAKRLATLTNNKDRISKMNPMEGYSGIPVFTCPEMQKRKWGRMQQPFFMNYEDLIDAWENCRGKPQTPAQSKEPVVEVFNLMDVLTSMDRELQDGGSSSSSSSTTGAQQRLLQHITFVPSSRSVMYKERITNTGNSKARLRPMR